MADERNQAPIRFTGHRYLVQRLVLATLTGRPIRISQIRASSPTHPGLAPHEVSFLRLLETITNGSKIEFSYTGTTLVYRPGLITGSGEGLGASGGVLRHELPAGCTRGLSYFLIPLCQLAPFSKAPVNVLFTGPGVITSATEAGDVSVDTVRTALLPLYDQFGISLKLEIRLVQRSCAGPGGKGGAGEVQLVFGHQVRLPRTLHLLNAGRIKRVRGVAYATGVPGANNARMIDAARAVLNRFAPDTYIFSDATAAPLLPAQPAPKGKANAPGAAAAATKKKRIGVGFGLALVAESSTGCLYSADVASPPAGGVAAEDVGRHCALQLLEVLSHGGCVSAVAAPTMLTLMAMGSEDVGRLRLGRHVVGSEDMMQLGRDVQALGGSGWGLRDADDNEGDIVVSVVGNGVANVGKKVA